MLSNLRKVKSKQDPSAFAARGLSCFTGRRGRRGVDEAPQSFGSHSSGTFWLWSRKDCTKAGVARGVRTVGEVCHFLGSGCGTRSVCMCVKGRGGGGASRTCVSHFEGSLRNGLHLFSDL